MFALLKFHNPGNMLQHSSWFCLNISFHFGLCYSHMNSGDVYFSQFFKDYLFAHEELDHYLNLL